MAGTAQYAKLAQSLPPPLLRFFARFPPPAPSPMKSSLNTSSSDPASNEERTVSTLSSLQESYNPFESQRHPETGKWYEPKFSLRRQAFLVKLAREHGVEELLPHTLKKTGERTKRREAQGLRVKGTGIGQNVKGHIWERTLKARNDRRKQAMLGMPKMVEQWKKVNKLNIFSRNLLINVDGSRAWVEEMAEMRTASINVVSTSKGEHLFSSPPRTIMNSLHLCLYIQTKLFGRIWGTNASRCFGVSMAHTPIA